MPTVQRNFSLLIILFLGTINAVATSYPRVKFLSLEQGLSNANALDIVHDDQGVTWIATELGLNKFAANFFHHYYKSEHESGLSVNSQEINKLLYDDDYLYIGTRANGLNVLDLKSGNFTYYTHDPTNKKSIATNDITDIRKGSDGAIWLSTYHQGVERFDQATASFEHYDVQNIPDLPSNSIWSLTEDQQGLLYFGHVNDGISILNKQTRQLERLHKENTDLGIPDNEIKVLLCDNKNNIWIGTRKGLAIYNPMSKQVRSIKLSQQAASEPFVYSISQVNDEIWVGTESSQIHIITPTYHDNNTIPDIQQVRQIDIGLGRHVSIQKISPDKFGNIWLAFYGGGVGFISHLNPFFKVIRGTNAIINGIVSRPKNAIWLLTEGEGLLQVQTKETTSTPTKLSNSLPEDFVLTGYQDRNKNVWVGLKNQGVSIFDAQAQRWRTLKTDEPLQEVRTIIEDSKGHIWLGTNRGIVIYDPIAKKTDKLNLHEPALGDYAPRALAEDANGNIWVGTYGQGVYIFNAEREAIAHFTSQNGLKSNSINHIFRDKNDNIWIATNEGIAYQRVRKELGNLQTIVPPKPHAWLFIQAISQDLNGDIWCSTKAGLLRYLPQKNRFYSYDRNFSIPLGGFKNNSVSSNENFLFFGMQDGVCFFDPEDIPINLPSSPIYLGTFTAFKGEESHQQLEKYTPGMRQVILTHSENSFRVVFGVADYALHGLTEFSYQLKGRDQDWTFLGKEQTLNFRNIPYGTYELLIRTRQQNEDWSDITRLSIAIEPPLYLTGYAKGGYILIASGILFAIVFFYRRKIKAEGELRLKKLEHQQQQSLATERLNFFTNITHELRTPLTLILGPLDDILQENNLTSKHRNLVQVVQNSANRLFSLVNQLLEFRKVESQYKPLVLGEGHLGELVQDVVDKYVDLNVNENIAIDCQIPTPDIRTTFDAEIIQMILDNLLSNAYKYTTAGAIHVSLVYEHEQLSTWAVLRVSDTGCGMDPAHLERIFDRFFQIENNAKPGTGIGLSMVKELVSVHYGKIDVSSTPEQGSEFCIRLLTNRVTSSTNNTSAGSIDSGEDTSTAQLPIVLLVEDDDDLRAYLASVLAERFIVCISANGLDGYQAAVEQIPDLIISDVMMDGMDGFDLVTKLKETTATNHIPIILFTAKDRDIDRQKGYEIGVDSYLTKPVHPTILIKRIENILSNRKNIQEHLAQKLHTTNAADEDTSEELWKESAFVQEFINIVERHMQDDILDAVTLAEKMNMSQSTLYRKLKALTGKNINQLVRKIRIRKAASLLRSRQYNVTEAAFTVGIHSSIYFRQCFKEEFGTLPSEYLKNAVFDSKTHF